MKNKSYLLRIINLSLVLVLIVAAVSLATFQPRQQAQAAPAGFVYACGIHFCLDGKPYYVAGANTYDLFTYGDGGSNATQSDIENKYMNKTRIDAHFANLQADGVNVLRLWMFSHETWHGFEITKGVYNEAEWMLFDYIIQSAKSHNVKLLPVFENYWEAYGGIDTRLAWEGLTGGQPGRAIFFNKSVCPGCFTQYKNYVNYALNRVNHYSGIAYKNDPTIFSWELMNEPRYEGVSAAENTGGATLRAWVDEMGAYIKGIDSNHMLGTGTEGHQAKYGFGGDEGNPFVYIHQSPYIDFTSAHPYPTETWANLTIAQTQALIHAWIVDSHTVVAKPFFMGEFNSHTGVRSDWWTGFYSQLETDDAAGSAFWWYADTNPDAKFGETHTSPEMSVFRAYAAAMKAKSGPFPTPTITPTTDPTRLLKVQYMTMNTGASSTQITSYLHIINSGVGLQYIPLSALKVRYYFTADTTVADTYGCLYAIIGCGNITGTIVTMSSPVATADHYLELTFSAAAGTLAPYADTGDIQARINKSDWSNYTQSNDYSFDGTKTAYADWNKVTLYYNGAFVWGVEPNGSPVATPTRTFTPTGPVITNTPTRTITLTSPGVTNTPTRTPTVGITNTPTRTLTAGITLTPTRTPTVGITNTPTRTPTVVGITNTPTRTLTPTVVPTGGPTCNPVTSSITAPFTYDGTGTFCWQSSNLGTYINSWNLTTLSINGTNFTNLYVAAGSYPAKINGYWYVSYNSTVTYGHFEAK
jgi:mannan endo-1,4-beta-mannosidase